MYLCLKNYATAESKAIDSVLRSVGVREIFNPSLHVGKTSSTLVFRGLAPGASKPFQAFLLKLNDRAEPVGDLENLTESLGQAIGFPVADPKLFGMGTGCWMTFNTGHFERPNSIYIAPVTSETSHMLRADLPARSEIEKNWGFFEQDGVLHAIYSLDPLVLLRECGRTADSVRFQAIHGAPGNWDGMPDMTIGTQPAFLPGYSDHIALIAHKRRYFWKKRVYTGRPVVVNLRKKTVHVGKTPLFHSLSGLLGDRLRHNPNLWSCSYFSGLSFMGECARISYGINDVDFGLADIPADYWCRLVRA